MEEKHAQALIELVEWCRKYKASLNSWDNSVAVLFEGQPYQAYYSKTVDKDTRSVKQFATVAIGSGENSHDKR